MQLSDYGDEDLIEALAERGIEVVYKKVVEKKIAEMENELKSWRDNEGKDPWDGGYNDGFEDAIKSFKKLIK